MLTFSLRAVLVWLALASVLSRDASADVVVSSSAEGNSGLAGEWEAYNYDSGQITDSRSASHSRTERAGGTVSAAQVSANLVPGQLDTGLRLRTHARAENNIGGDTRAKTWVAAQWGDTIRISNANPLADHLAVTFSIRGEYGYNDDQPGIHELDMGMGVVDLSRYLLADTFVTAGTGMNNPFAFNTFPLSAMDIRRGSWINDGDLDFTLGSVNGGIATGFFAIEPFAVPPSSSVFNEEVTGAFGWQQTLFVPYMAEIGGYNLNMAVYSYSQAYQNGSIGIDAWNTITLDAVKFVDGSEILDPVVFDSGFSIAAVPEPSSLLMLCSGSLTYAIFRRHRRSFTCEMA